MARKNIEGNIGEYERVVIGEDRVRLLRETTMLSADNAHELGSLGESYDS